jgi:hypothetical protein
VSRASGRSLRVNLVSKAATHSLLLEKNFACNSGVGQASSLLPAQTRFACLHDFEHASVYVILRGVLTETDSTSAQSHVPLHAHGTQRGAHFAGVARSPNRESNFILELVLYLVTHNSGERDADDLQGARWQSKQQSENMAQSNTLRFEQGWAWTDCWYHGRTLSVKDNSHVVVPTPFFYKLNYSAPDSCLEKGAVAAQPLLRFTARHAHRGAVHDRLCAGAPSPLLRGSNYQRWDVNTPAHKQRSGSRRPAEFVARYGQEVTAQLGNVDGNFSSGLAGVDVHQGADLMRGVANLTNGLHNACFVLYEHDGNHAGFGRERGGEGVQINEAVGQHCNHGCRVAGGL